jgi:large subunit ribosomal protein L29
MKIIKMNDIESLNAKDIDIKIDEIKKELFDLKIQKVTSGVEKPHVRNVLKKNVARLLTRKNSIK